MDTGDNVNNVLTGREDSPYKGSLNSELRVILKQVLSFPRQEELRRDSGSLSNTGKMSRFKPHKRGNNN